LKKKPMFGVPKKYIQEIMGHKDGRSTDVYIHPGNKKKKEYLDSRGKVPGASFIRKGLLKLQWR